MIKGTGSRGSESLEFEISEQAELLAFKRL